MRARPAVLVAALGVAAAALARMRRRRRDAPGPGVAATTPDPRAEELRRKLADSRAIVDEREVFEEAELPIDRAEPLGDPDRRRREVHEHARDAAARMRERSDM